MSTPAEHSPLTPEELARDGHDSYYEAIRVIGERHRAGEPLNDMFRARREAEAGR